jgi:hypothetical protein
MAITQDVSPSESTNTYGSKLGYQQIRPQFDQQKMQQSFGYVPQSRMVSGYGMNMQMDTQPQQPLPLSPEDIMCQGKQAGTVIPLEDTRIYVTCLDDSKGVSQKCPPHLHYITNIPVPRCEKKLSQLLPPCLSNPCQNGGQCSELDIFTYKCDCPVGWEGQQCERDQRACLQQPCGQDGVCKGFRFGSALTFVCICQDGNSYGPNCQQAIPNPCQSTEQYLPMSYTDKGFVMCDGERFFIESCPGTTTWDNSQKTCVSMDMPLAQDQGNYQQQSGGYQQQLPQTQSWTKQQFEQPMRPRQQMSGMTQQFDMPREKSMMSSQGYGQQQFDMPREKPMMMRPQFDMSREKSMMSSQGYEQQPQLDMPREKSMMSSQGYGQQLDMPIQKSVMMRPQFDMSREKSMMSSQGYEQQPQLDMMPQQTSSMYGSKQMQQDVQPSVSGYSSGIQQQFDTPKPHHHRTQHIASAYSPQQFDISQQKPMISQQGYSSGVQQQDMQMQPQRFADTSSSMYGSKQMQQDIQPSVGSGSSQMFDQRRQSSMVQQPQFDATKTQQVGGY